MSVPVINKDLGIDIKAEIKLKNSKNEKVDGVEKKKKSIKKSLNENFQSRLLNAVLQNRLQKRIILFKVRKIVWKFVQA